MGDVERVAGEGPPGGHRSAHDRPASGWLSCIAQAYISARRIHIVRVDLVRRAGILFAQALALGFPFKLAANQSIFAVIVTRGTPTLVSTSALTLSVRIIPG